ncbi:MAG TPA: alpha/beta hydrolase-fold protein, partial [Planctomycetaceae bacterium]|nr:alpha/beta hydrolase-fold protein [Planctomycetaceae bacterium]
MVSRHWFVVLGCLVLLSPASFAEDVSPADRALLREIADAWQKRERHCQTGRFRWEADTFESSGGGMEVGCRATEEFWFGPGWRRRHHFKGGQHDDKGKVRDIEVIKVDDGAGGYRELSLGSLNHPVGFIVSSRWGNRRFMPLAWLFGKLPPKYTLDPTTMRVLDPKYAFGNRTAVLLEKPDFLGPGKSGRLVIDPQQGHSAVRITIVEASGATDYEFNISYRKEKPEVWVPEKWSYTGSGSPRIRVEARVLECEINPDLSASTFELEFPTGTVVYNDLTKEFYVQTGDATGPLPSEAAKISAAERDDNTGIITHTVRSPLQSAPIEIRVLLPAKFDPQRTYPVVYALPVEAGRENRYGDALEEIRQQRLHERYPAVFVAPTFARLPWYADHSESADLRQYSYFLQVVVPFVHKTYPVEDKPHLLGFSKSGWGAWSLLLRNPKTFGRAAAWDA